MNTCASFAAECDYEAEDDDVFYAELRKQILLLTDDEDFPQHPRSSRVIRQSANTLTAAVATRSYCRWEECELSTTPAPAWLLKLWRNGSGTGVFIPHIVKPRRLPVTGTVTFPFSKNRIWFLNQFRGVLKFMGFLQGGRTSQGGECTSHWRARINRSENIWHFTVQSWKFINNGGGCLVMLPLLERWVCQSKG